MADIEYNPDGPALIQMEDWWKSTTDYNITESEFAKGMSRGDGYIGTKNGINLFISKKTNVELPAQAGIGRRA